MNGASSPGENRDWAGAVVLGYPGVPTMALGAFGLWARYQLSLVDWGIWLDLGTFAQAVRASTPIADQTQQIFIPLFTTPPPDLSSMLALVPQNPLWFMQAVRLPLALAAAVSLREWGRVIESVSRQKIGWVVAAALIGMAALDVLALYRFIIPALS